MPNVTWATAIAAVALAVRNVAGATARDPRRAIILGRKGSDMRRVKVVVAWTMSVSN